MQSRVSPATLAADRATLQALLELTDFAPVNPGVSPVVLNELEASVTHASEKVARLRRALVTARADELAAMNEFHEGIQGAKNAVVAQYGKDSWAVRAIGRKRRMDYKRPRRAARKNVAP